MRQGSGGSSPDRRSAPAAPGARAGRRRLLARAVARRARAADAAGPAATRRRPARVGLHGVPAHGRRSPRRWPAGSATCTAGASSCSWVLAALSRRHARRGADLVARGADRRARASRDSAVRSSRSRSASSATSSTRGSVARGTAWMSAILGAGGVLGIVLAGPILEHLSYHWLFWIPLVVTVASTGGGVLGRAAPARRRTPGGVNWLSAALLAGWLVCLLLGVSEGPRGAGRRGGCSACSPAAAVARARVARARDARARTRSSTCACCAAAACGRRTSSAVLRRLGHVQRVRARAAADRRRRRAPAASARPSRRPGSTSSPWTFAVAIASAVSGPALGALRLAPAAHHRLRDQHGGLRHGCSSSTTTRGRSSSRRRRSARARGSRSRRWSIS